MTEPAYYCPELIPTEDLMLELHRRSAFCFCFTVEKNEDDKENVGDLVIKGNPSTLGRINGALVYDTAMMIYEENKCPDLVKSYIDAFEKSYKESRKELHEEMNK